MLFHSENTEETNTRFSNKNNFVQKLFSDIIFKKQKPNRPFISFAQIIFYFLLSCSHPYLKATLKSLVNLSESRKGIQLEVAIVAKIFKMGKFQSYQ